MTRLWPGFVHHADPPGVTLDGLVMDAWDREVDAHHEPLPITLPSVGYGELWESVLDIAPTVSRRVG